MRFDSTGKISFDHIYTEPDPRAYFNTLSELDYQIPQLAKPYFAKLVREFQDVWRVSKPTVLDLGCSYGINAVLHKCDMTMGELSDRYRGSDVMVQDRDTLLADDRELVRSRDRDRASFVGLDVSQPALEYALSAGFIDGAVHADLETADPTERQREQLADVDMVISTGCLGYVTEKTVSRIVAARGDRRPWMAHFVLRMFSYEPIADSLAPLGYETIGVDGVFKQRRFASAEEQSQVLDTLSTAGVDPDGLESEGWFYAQLYLSRPL